MLSKMAKNDNQMHNNCIKSSDSTEESIVANNSIANVDITGDNSVVKYVENIVESVEKTIESNVQMNGESSNDFNQTIDNLKVEIKGQTNVESIVDSKSGPKDDSSPKPMTKYIRKTPTETLTKIWEIVDSQEWHKSVDDLNKSLSKRMLNEFNVKLSESKLTQMMDRAVNEKLIIVEKSSDNKIRYVPNFDPKLFGEVSNDWLCFECHYIFEDEDLIDCKTCFRAFHLKCLKGGNKTIKSRDESFDSCLYCRRLNESDSTLKVNQMSKPELNKCISLMFTNLELVFGGQTFDEYSEEQSEQNKVLIFKPMDLKNIKLRAQTDQYSKLEELVNDLQHLIHNWMVSDRDQSNQSSIKEFERKFNHEIKELKLCVDCYKYSSDLYYDKDEDPHDWFTLVCDPPHELVFAKFGKYPYWPAKVIEIKSGGKQYDVRFFDAPEFSRAVIPIKRLKAIEGFKYEDEDNDLELPVKLMEKHIGKMRAKGVYFMPTLVNSNNRSEKKRPKAETKVGDQTVKRPKKTLKK